MNGNGDGLNAAFTGFSEGLGLVLVEMVAAILISMLLTIQQITNQTIPQNTGFASTFNLPLMLALFAIMNIAESLAIGMGDMIYAVSYCIGAIFSLFLFGTAIASLFPQAVSATIGVIVIVIIGIFIKLIMVSRRL
jgi:hypothetical protein